MVTQCAELKIAQSFQIVKSTVNCIPHKHSFCIVRKTHGARWYRCTECGITKRKNRNGLKHRIHLAKAHARSKLCRDAAFTADYRECEQPRAER